MAGMDAARKWQEALRQRLRTQLLLAVMQTCLCIPGHVMDAGIAGQVPLKLAAKHDICSFW